jgi:hypothetical protein
MPGKRKGATPPMPPNKKAQKADSKQDDAKDDAHDGAGRLAVFLVRVFLC